MALLVLFAFLAGIVTILSPCVLPVLPIVLASSTGNGKRRPLGIVLGFILSFTFFTLFLTEIVKLLGIPSDSLRTISIVVILGFGISLLIPRFQIMLERLFGRLSRYVPSSQNSTGFVGGVILGLSLGLLWTPCVGPILASVITLAATSTVTIQTILITVAYSTGTAIPMFGILLLGKNLFQRVPWVLRNTIIIQKVFGVLMILTAIGIFFNFDRRFQTYILDKFPQYGAGLTNIENNSLVHDQLTQLTSPQSLEINGELLNVKNPEPAPEFIVGGKWFNTKPLTLSSLKGKVVLVDFWTYTCINCIRTIPYLKDWFEKYQKDGLVIVGVHTPEFEFEHESANVSKAISDFGIKYPVVQDNDYATWNAYYNQYWPAEYLIDKDGKIRRTHFGEGEYDQTEMAIQSLLSENGQPIQMPLSKITDQTPTTSLSPETYVGSARAQYYYPSSILENGIKQYSFIGNPPQDSFTLGGEWNISDEYATSSNGSVLLYHFFANKVFLVMAPGTNNDAKVKITIDGKDVDSGSAGSDVKSGLIKIDSDRLYNLIDLKGASGSHTLKLEFQNPLIQVFAFTFG